MAASYLRCFPWPRPLELLQQFTRRYSLNAASAIVHGGGCRCVSLALLAYSVQNDAGDDENNDECERNGEADEDNKHKG